MRTLIIGCGNPLHGDDGVGWHVAARVGECLDDSQDVSEVQSIACYRLTPELADAVGRADLVVFVEAGYGARAGDVTCTAVPPAARRGTSALQNSVGPEELLTLARRAHRSAPPAYLLTVTGDAFGPRFGLSPVVEHACAGVLRRIGALMFGHGGRTLKSNGVPLTEMYGYA